jgi:hypothetical protein
MHHSKNMLSIRNQNFVAGFKDGFPRKVKLAAGKEKWISMLNKRSNFFWSILWD